MGLCSRPAYFPQSNVLPSIYICTRRPPNHRALSVTLVMTKANINFVQPWTSDGRPESENKNYNIGSSVNVAWDVTLDNAFVTLNQVGESGGTGGPFVILPGT